MSYLVASGSVVLNGPHPVPISVPAIEVGFIRVARGVDRPMEGTLVYSEIQPGIGFSVSSTSPKDKGVIVYIQVYDETDFKPRNPEEDD
jgi:hypothetical protein